MNDAGGSDAAPAEPPPTGWDGGDAAPQAPVDASVDSSTGTTDDAGVDGGSPDDGLVPATPVDPCSDDLAMQRGAVQPGYGDPTPGEALSGDPADDGAFAVLTVDLSIANPDPARDALDATFYAPSLDDGASVAPERHPLALVMHGFGVTHREYEHFTRHLASHGLIVLGITMPFTLTAAHDKNVEEAIAAIDLALSDAAPEAVRGHVDGERIAALGHSFGGKIAFYAAALDPRIDVVVGWDPSNAGGPPCFVDAEACNDFPVAPNCLADDSGILHQMQAETLVFRAAPDGANPEPAHNAIHFYRAAPSPATLVDFDGNIAHGDFASPVAPVIEHTRRVQLALLLSRFLGTPDLEGYLPDGDQLDDEPLVVRVVTRWATGR